jgi:hypothetical protein
MTSSHVEVPEASGHGHGVSRDERLDYGPVRSHGEEPLQQAYVIPLLLTVAVVTAVIVVMMGMISYYDIFFVGPRAPL